MSLLSTTFQGTILDNVGEPLPNVNILLPEIIGFNGTKVGTATDLDGNFYLNNKLLTPLSKVVITAVGFEPIYTTVSQINYKTTLMKEAILQGNEVVVTGKRPNNWGWLLVAVASFTFYKVATAKKPKKITI